MHSQFISSSQTWQEVNLHISRLKCNYHSLGTELSEHLFVLVVLFSRPNVLQKLHKIPCFHRPVFPSIVICNPIIKTDGNMNKHNRMNIEWIVGRPLVLAICRKALLYSPGYLECLKEERHMFLQWLQCMQRFVRYNHAWIN